MYEIIRGTEIFPFTYMVWTRKLSTTVRTLALISEQSFSYLQ